MARRLTENHPAFKAVNKLFSFMEENKISITINGYGESTVTVDGKTFKLCDLEQTNYPIDTVPLGMEYKLLTIDED